MATISYTTYGPGSSNYNPSGNNSYVSYDGGAMVSTSGNQTAPVATPTTPTVNPNQSKIDSLLSQVKSIQSVIDKAKASGITSGEIPQSISGVAPKVNPNQAKIDEYTKQVNAIQNQLNEAQQAGYKTGEIKYDSTGKIVPLLPKDTKEMELSGIDNINLPDTTAYDKLTTYANSVMVDLENKKNALTTTLQKQLDDSKKERDALQKTMDSLTSKAQSVIDKQDPTKTDTYEQEKRIIQNKLDAAESASSTVQKNFDDNQKLTDELGTLLTDIQADLQATKNVTGLAAIRNPRIAQSSEQATARVGVIEAVMAARNGQINQANTLIDKAFESTQAAKKDQLNYLNTVLGFIDKQRDETGNKLISVDKEVKNNVQSQIAMLENELTISQNNVEQIKQAMQDPDTAMAYAQSGVTLNDSPEQINQKLAQYSYTKEISETSNDMASKGYTALVSGSAPAGSEVVRVADSQGNFKTWYKQKEIKPIAETKPEKPTEKETLVIYKQGMLQELKDSNSFGTNGKITPKYWNKAKAT